MLGGTKQLPEKMYYHQLDSQDYFSLICQSDQKYKNNHWRKCIWKCLQNGGHCFQASEFQILKWTYITVQYFEDCRLHFSLGRNGVGSNLKWVHLGGCANVTDATLMRLALALSQADLPNPEQTACNNQCGVSVTEQSCLCEEVRNMEKTLAQLKVENMQSSWTANSSGYPERHVKIHLDKNAMDYSNQKARDKNRRSDCEINGMCCMNETTEPNNSCHAGCHTGGAVESAIEECAGHQRKSRVTSGGCKTNQTQTCDKNSVSLTDWKKQSQTHFVRTLSYLNLSGCYQITDVGLR